MYDWSTGTFKNLLLLISYFIIHFSPNRNIIFVCSILTSTLYQHKSLSHGWIFRGNFYLLVIFIAYIFLFFTSFSFLSLPFYGIYFVFRPFSSSSAIFKRFFPPNEIEGGIWKHFLLHPHMILNFFIFIPPIFASVFLSFFLFSKLFPIFW